MMAASTAPRHRH